VLGRLRRLLPGPPTGETWFGDDAAVLRVPGPKGGPLLLLAADAVVGGLDADLALTSLADLGWKAMAVNLSDIAAMGGRPAHAVVSVVGLAPDEIEELYAGVLAAAAEYGCPVVGGDLSGGDQVVVSVAITGWVDGAPVLRSGARPGDQLWVTGAVGAAAAGLRWLRAHHGAGQDLAERSSEAVLVRAHARPRPAVAEGAAARAAGATAMIDVSDGLIADLGRLAAASSVGFDLLGVDQLPVAVGATVEEALSGGDDYVLAFALPAGAHAREEFERAGLPSPHLVGTCVEDARQRTSAGRALVAGGWEHDLYGTSRRTKDLPQ